MLAKATGWAESFIVWQLPLVRLLAYEHANLRANDVWTVKRKPVSEHSLAPIRKFFGAAPEEDDD